MMARDNDDMLLLSLTFDNNTFFSSHPLILSNRTFRIANKIIFSSKLCYQRAGLLVLYDSSPVIFTRESLPSVGTVKIDAARGLRRMNPL